MDRLVRVVGQCVKAVAEPPSVREGELGIDLQQGDEDEAARADLAVGKVQPVRAVLELTEQ